MICAFQLREDNAEVGKIRVIQSKQRTITHHFT